MKLFILIPSILLILLALIIIFRKSIKQFLLWLYNLLIDVFKSILKTISSNKIIKAFFDNHPRFKKFLNDRFDKNSKYGLKLTIFLFTILICIIWFISIGEGYINQELVFQYDLRLNNLFLFFRDQHLINIFTFITNIADPKMILAGAALFSIFLYISKNKEYIFPFFISIGSASILDSILKIIFNRPRPSISFYAESNASFPSGHATIVVAFFGFICYFLIKNSKKNRNKILYIIAFVIISALVGFSRLYLGAHYLTDVLGGFLLGLISLLSSICISELFFIKNNKNKNLKNFYLFVLAFILLLISFTLLFKQKINPLKVSFLKNINMQYVNSDINKQFDSNKISKYSEQLSGQVEEPISFIIIANSDTDLINLFNKTGWELAQKPTLQSVINVIMAAIKNKQDPSAPMTPSFWDTQVHNFGFEKATIENTSRKRHHARFWGTNILIDGKKVYLGTASLDIGIKWGITHTIAPDIDTERDFLFNDLNQTGLIKKYNKQLFVSPTLGKNFAGDTFFTNGEAYMIEL